MARIQDPHDARLTQLSSLITVSLHDSGNDAKPTVEIRDKGIGLKSEDFSKTILSLNESNKIGKLHLMGACTYDVAKKYTTGFRQWKPI